MKVNSDNDLLICEMQKKIDDLEDFKAETMRYIPGLKEKISYMVALEEKLRIATEALDTYSNTHNWIGKEFVCDNFYCTGEPPYEEGVDVAKNALLEIQRIDDERGNE